MPIARSNGVDLFYEDQGPRDGPAILLIMGLGTQMIAWSDTFRDGLVARGFRVVSYDNRDIGRSTALAGALMPGVLWTALAAKLRLPLRLAYSLTDMARDAIGLLDALEISAAHFVGASMGGAIAQIAAAEFPDRVASLTSIMATSGAPGLPGPPPALRRQLMKKRPPSATRAEAATIGADVARLLAYPDPARPAEAFRLAAERAYDRGFNPDGIRRQLLAIIADGSRADRLPRIMAPTLVIHGAADRLVPLACGKDIAKRIPGARLEVIEAMAHDLPPSQIVTLVSLIAKHASGAAADDAKHRPA